MRANEFIIEGPIDSASDWMQKQVIGRKQIDQRKAREQNVPKIAKAVQEILASKVAKFLKTDTSGQGGMSDKLSNYVTQILTKTAKVKVDSDPYNNALDLIKTQIAANPDNILGNTRITSAISDIINTSFKSQDDDSADPFGAYQAEVYDLPREVADEDMLYAEHNGKWTLWRKTGKNRLAFVNDIEPEEVSAVKELINATKTKSALLSFKQQQGNFYQTSSTVPD